MNHSKVSTIFWSVLALYSIGLIAMLGVLALSARSGPSP